MTRKDHAKQPWLVRLLDIKPATIASLALANKIARTA
jgi:transposase